MLFIAMRFVPGRDLRAVLAGEGPLAPKRVAEFISPVASALDAAHRAGAADQVLARATAKVPEKRHGSCREFADALRDALGKGTVLVRNTAPAAEEGDTGRSVNTAVFGPAVRPGHRKRRWQRRPLAHREQPDLIGPGGRAAPPSAASNA